MYKLIVFAALLSIAAARPSIIAGPAIIHAIPAAVSHQSHTQIHTRPVVVAPVIHTVPIVHHPIVHPHVVHPIIAAHPGSVWVHG